MSHLLTYKWALNLGTHKYKDENNRHWGLQKERRREKGRWVGGERAENFLLGTTLTMWVMEYGIKRSPNISITLYILETNLHMKSLNLKYKTI